ncbi:hypothetical protein L2E82_14928 [Cichorium intybus]|uniref:Uncharacterized protein n=1 Tax=Cichorium intybus TaxID=13427 RepID=A0ACB9F1S3_CICIN|nr:hypothetical protein L2E82_14928 [Cichorium intybus]
MEAIPSETWPFSLSPVSSSLSKSLPFSPSFVKDLHLYPLKVDNAGKAAFNGSIVSLLAMGPAYDLFSSCLASATLSLVTAPILYNHLIIIMTDCGPTTPMKINIHPIVQWPVPPEVLFRLGS